MKNLSFAVTAGLFVVWMARKGNGLEGVSRLSLFAKAMGGGITFGTPSSSGSGSGGSSSSTGGGTGAIPGTSSLPSSAQSDLGSTAGTQGSITAPTI